MSPDALFQLANALALAGWIALACSPLAPRVLSVLGGMAIPLLISGSLSWPEPGQVQRHWTVPLHM